MKQPPYEQDASQQERRRMLKQDQAQPTTMFEQARVAEQIDSERSKSAVMGTKPVVDFPAIPSGPWSAGYWQDGPEPPLGYSVNDLEPTGEVAEVQRSLEELAASSSAPPSASSPEAVVATDDAAIQATDRPLRLRLPR
jgi:hypothetical protein